jgi:chromosome partitioning protein
MKEKKPLVISILNQKGGVGKTTIATNLAHGLHLREYNVLLVDGDPQGSARDWHEANLGILLPCIGLDRETLLIDLKAVWDGYDIVVIDGAPQIAKLSAVAIRASDVVLIPVQPSPYDIWATADLVELIKQRQEVSEGNPKAAFILSRIIKNTNLSRDVIEALKEYELPILDARTSQYVAYAYSASKGESVFSSSAASLSQASVEFKEIIDEIIKRYLDIKI